LLQRNAGTEDWKDVDYMFWKGVGNSVSSIEDPDVRVYVWRYYILGSEGRGLTHTDIIGILGKPPEPKSEVREDETGLEKALKKGTAFGLKYGAEHTTTEEGFHEAKRLIEEAFPRHALNVGVLIALSHGEGMLFKSFLERLVGPGYRLVNNILKKRVGRTFVNVADKEAKAIERYFRAEGIPLSGKLNAPNATNPVLRSAYQEMWRKTDLRPGGTISELLREIEGGVPLKHLDKAKTRLSQLKSLLSDAENPLSQADRLGVQRVINDLKDAIKKAGE
jgi:hypothetical protein